MNTGMVPRGISKRSSISSSIADVQFTVHGQRGTLSADQVRKHLRGRTPGPIQEHGVEIDGTVFAVKEAFSLVTGLDLLDFNTNQARDVFRRLGFPLVRRSALAARRS